MSQELGVSPRVLDGALSGGSMEASTVLARAGQIAEAGHQMHQQGGHGGAQLSEAQNRLVSSYESGNGLISAAVTAYHGTDSNTLSAAASGNHAAEMAVQNNIHANSELARSGSAEAHSIMTGASAITYGGSDVQQHIAGQGGYAVNVDPVVASANAHNTEALLTQMSGGDARAVDAVLHGSPEQRAAFVERMSAELGVSPSVLNGAINGGSMEASTVLA